MLVRIDTRFEARHRHWMAEATEQVQRRAAEPGNRKSRSHARPDPKTQEWDEIEISFPER